MPAAVSDEEVPLSRLEADAGGGRGRRLATPRRLLAAATLLALLALYAYDYTTHGALVGQWFTTRSDWLFLGSVWLLAVLASATVPNRALAARYWERLREHRAATVGLFGLLALFVVGLVGPLVTDPLQPNPYFGLQPPVFGSVPADSVTRCAGEVVGDRCHGSMRFPLGSTTLGFDVATAVVAGARLATYVTVVTAALIVPLGAAVGVVAGYFGGWVDTVLMRYVDIQQTVPAVVAYVVLVVVVGKSLFMLLVVFGLFSWGGVARVVRAETRQRREAGYVIAGRSVGGGDGYLIRRHVLPNVSHGVVTALGQQVPLLLVTEAAIAYLGLNDIDQTSWGDTIAQGLSNVFGGWWVAGFPVLALALTVLAMKLFGDALRDVLDPKEG